jgi:hypothetical protein
MLCVSKQQDRLVRNIIISFNYTESMTEKRRSDGDVSARFDGFISSPHGNESQKGMNRVVAPEPARLFT